MVRTLMMIASLAALLGLVGQADAQSWGTIKGQVVWAGDTLPEKEKAKVDKDQAQCLKNGDIYTDAYVVNPKNKGVRWVLVSLQDAETPTKAIPIHPSLEAVSKKPLELDQPCCAFEPRVAAIREGQQVVVKNSASIAHNIFWQGGLLGPTANQLVPAGGQAEFKDIKARALPVPYTCSIHAWMKGYVGVFKHPYFAVTDADGKFEIKNAPAGKFRLNLWQETKGWVIINPTNPRDRGVVIDIKADGTTDLGTIKFELAK